MTPIRRFQPTFRVQAVALIAAFIPIAALASDAPAPARPAVPVVTASAAQEVTPDTAAPIAITQPLNPKTLNIFNFGPHVFKVQYPAGSSFSGVNMTVTAVQISQAAFAKRVAGTGFANSTCVVYTGEAGNCIDYQVTCTNSDKTAIVCPGSSASNISVWTSYDSTQSEINPGFISSAIGKNAWGNTFDYFYMQKVDPTAHGHTNGWSEFVTVALGVTNREGLGEFTFNAPLATTNTRSFPAGQAIPVSFHLASVVDCGTDVTDAMAGLTVVRISDADGNKSSGVYFNKQNAFKYTNGNYDFTLPTANLPAGSYVLTIFGNAFVSQATYFTVQ